MSRYKKTGITIDVTPEYITEQLYNSMGNRFIEKCPICKKPVPASSSLWWRNLEEKKIRELLCMKCESIFIVRITNA